MENIEGWVPLAEYCKLTGEKAATVHKRVHDGGWERGVHYSAPADTGSGYVNVAAAEAWRKRKSVQPEG
jgi:hypothetical protein